jgi:hypothetical protein
VKLYIDFLDEYCYTVFVVGFLSVEDDMFKSWDDLTEEEQLLSTISDVYKDINGFRPRSIYNDMSVEQLRSALDDLYVEAEESFNAEQELRKSNDKDFKSTVKGIMEMCRCSFVDAIRYLKDAEDVDDIDYFLWDFGLTSEYTMEIKNKLKGV